MRVPLTPGNAAFVQFRGGIGNGALKPPLCISPNVSRPHRTVNCRVTLPHLTETENLIPLLSGEMRVTRCDSFDLAVEVT